MAAARGDQSHAVEFGLHLQHGLWRRPEVIRAMRQYAVESGLHLRRGLWRRPPSGGLEARVLVQPELLARPVPRDLQPLEVGGWQSGPWGQVFLKGGGGNGPCG